ncbi:MAG TPA: cysteine--tRNA ligase, partial [Myxococcota bacterium]|nr:cysteine--tRNA ligase [Myxococcota bacterium]
QAARELKLELHDTLARARRRFEPLQPGKVSMYTCGPTVDAPPTLALLRRMLVADLLRRALEYLGLEVRHVVNITDLDDNTIQASERLGEPLKTLTARETEGFLAALDALRIKRAWKYPRASEHVDDMAAFTRRLIERGFAYERLRSVYFDIGKHARYGALSGLDLTKIRLGTTVDLDEYQKDDPRDFTLFKRSTLAEMARDIFFETEWGNGRPGLHVECACMSTRFLGEEFDIHTGSTDLIFPHNENEMAQCEALHGKSQARFWLHSEPVLVDGKKMSRPAGNAVTLADVQALGYTGRELRYLLASFHYRQPLTYSPKGLQLARAALRRIDTFVWRLTQAARAEAPEASRPPPAEPPAAEEACQEAGPEAVAELAQALTHEFDEALQADLNVPKALGALFSMIRKVNLRLVQGLLTRAEAQLLLDTLRKLEPALGLLDFAVASPGAEDAELEALVHRREEARERKDYGEADRIRDELRARGVTLEDTLQGTLFWIEPQGKGRP